LGIVEILDYSKPTILQKGPVVIPEISIQLYSVREQLEADYEGTIRALATIGFGNVEPAGYPGSSPEEAAKLFSELGIKAPSCHGSLPIGDDKNRVIEEALMMGHEYVMTGCPPKFREHYESVDAVKAMIDLYCEAAENVASHGVSIGYHNHDWDLALVEGKRGYEYFLEKTPDTVLWEADLYWVARAGLDPVAFVKEIGARGKCLHFKDGIVDGDGDATFLPAGAGQVDLGSASKAAEHVEYAIVELDSYEGDMMAAVEESYLYLTANGIAVGRGCQ